MTTKCTQVQHDLAYHKDALASYLQNPIGCHCAGLSHYVLSRRVAPEGVCEANHLQGTGLRRHAADRNMTTGQVSVERDASTSGRYTQGTGPAPIEYESTYSSTAPNDNPPASSRDTAHGHRIQKDCQPPLWQHPHSRSHRLLHPASSAVAVQGCVYDTPLHPTGALALRLLGATAYTRYATLRL